MLTLMRQHVTLDAFRLAFFSRRTFGGLALGLSFLAVIAVLGLKGMKVADYTRDLAILAHTDPLKGALSTFGLLLWSASAAVWYCIRIVAAQRGRADMRALATCSILLTAWVLLDDAFMVHEQLAQRFFNIPERMVMAAIASAALAYAFYFHALLIRSIFPLLFAGIPLGTSMLLDTFGGRRSAALLGQWQYFLEDGCKWMGIVGWLGFAILQFRLLIAEPSGLSPAASPAAPE